MAAGTSAPLCANKRAASSSPRPSLAQLPTGAHRGPRTGREAPPPGRPFVLPQEGPPAVSTINPPADSASAAMAHKGTETLRFIRVGHPAKRSTHLLPAGRPGSGLVRLAGPAPTAGPCRGPRPSRRGARPATLARCSRIPRQDPGCARHCTTTRQHGKESRGHRFLSSPEAEERPPRPAPPAAAILFHSTRSGQGRRPS